MGIYVGNLSYSATSEEVSALFAEYGSVESVYLPVDRETGRIRGFGFVNMVSESDEDAAIEALNGAELMGRALRVNKARPREKRQERSLGGDDRQSGWGDSSRQRDTISNRW